MSSLWGLVSHSLPAAHSTFSSWPSAPDMAREVLPSWVGSFRLSLLTLLCRKRRQKGATRQLWKRAGLEQGAMLLPAAVAGLSREGEGTRGDLWR